MLNTVKKTLTRLSPRLATHIFYLKKFKKKLNLKNPKTFNEKILWLKLNQYKDNQLISDCADKYKVRNYITEKGCKEILNSLIFVCDTTEQIPLDQLPENGFALKCNHGAGYNIICKDKYLFNTKESLSKINHWLKDDYWLSMAEIHYKNIRKKVICEALLVNKNNELPEDYKVYCFNGTPQFVMICTERSSGNPKYYFVDKTFKILPFGFAYQKEPNPTLFKPEGFDDLFYYSNILCKEFTFVRADFYIVDGKIFFGELTFTPAAGLDTRISNLVNPDGDLIMGKYLDITKLK